MKKFKHGLIIGKFYPFHVGHEHLITVAAMHCEKVTVIIMGSTFDSIPVWDRCRAIESYVGMTFSTFDIGVREVFDNVYDDYDDKGIWTVHDSLIRENMDSTVDSLFTSEAYGEQLAENLGIEHFLVDLNRTTHPISGTQIRSDVVGKWDSINPWMRQYSLRTHVVVMGAESTGTTTLANDLRDGLVKLGKPYEDTACIPEFGRKYTEDRIESEKTRDLDWDVDHFCDIMDGQSRLENMAKLYTTSPVIVSDTDSLATLAFADYFGIEDENMLLESYLSNYKTPDIYLITHHEDLPLVDDGSRLQDVEKRNASTQFFIDQCKYHSRPYAVITGDREERAKLALRITLKLVEMKTRISDPI